MTGRSRLSLIAVCWSLIVGLEVSHAEEFAMRGVAWPEADQLFRRDTRWRGSDAANSIDLGEGRVLWTFGDSFVDNNPVAAQRQRKTARFIRNLTSDGCIWYLGAKIEKEEKSTDLDLLAIADGSLIVGECKSLEFNQGTQGAIWKRLTEQLATPIDVAKELGARVFVLSSLVERYPKTFQDQLKRLAGDSIVLLLLTKSDLETGSRQIKDQVGHERVLNLKTLFHPARNRQIVKKSRKSGRSMWF